MMGVLVGLPLPGGGEFQIPQTVLETTGMVGVVGLLGILAGRRVRERPSEWQAALEWGYRYLENLLSEVTEKEAGYRYVPLVATLAVFILSAALMGTLPLLEAPTANLNTTVALALIVFFAAHYYGIQEHGWGGYLRQFAEPTWLLVPINVLGHITRTISLAIRLFANMLSHQVIIAVLLLIAPLVIPVLFELFGLFIGALQAYIFTLLTIVYIGGAVRAQGAM
ncbi:ATP synthase F0 subcomplex A subunit [Halogranum amylolyticum]|uniref:ATP synthase F0 subcomplex A subunit n=1 Tax=Halogranum amylolyticum TaxID=660520 RepID=A0A1H8UZK9_9EURY|nr:F0F1 ATP synthase subunit A [Halogranum amylolyticum]SEP08606.1 ATP synthase F0 subcomplex A subunit [Halogranum amylolyticum]